MSSILDLDCALVGDQCICCSSSLADLCHFLLCVALWWMTHSFLFRPWWWELKCIAHVWPRSWWMDDWHSMYNSNIMEHYYFLVEQNTTEELFKKSLSWGRRLLRKSQSVDSTEDWEKAQTRFELVSSGEVGAIKYEWRILQEGPATHLCLVLIVCRSNETKPHIAGPPSGVQIPRNMVVTVFVCSVN